MAIEPASPDMKEVEKFEVHKLLKTCRKGAAKLVRVTRLGSPDRGELYSFIVPSMLLSESTAEVSSRDFSFAGHRWVLSLTRANKHVGAFLTWKSPCPFVSCQLFFRVHMLSPKHCVRNHTHEKCHAFTKDFLTFGCRDMISLEKLDETFGTDELEDISVELELRHKGTVFETVTQFAHNPSKQLETRDSLRGDTRYMMYGGFHWHSTVTAGSDMSAMQLSLIRLNGDGDISHLTLTASVSVKSKVWTTDGCARVEIGTEGVGPPVPLKLNTPLSNATLKEGDRVHLSLTFLNRGSVKKLTLKPCKPGHNRAHFFDADYHCWMLQSDLLRPKLRFRLYFCDIHQVPLNCLKVTSFSLVVVPIKEWMSKQTALDVPLCETYIQSEMDADGLIIRTDIPVSLVTSKDHGYLAADGSLLVEVVWLSSHLVQYPTFRQTDSLALLHRHQMKRELECLQSRNTALERQLHKYQLNIGLRTSKKLVHRDSDTSLRE